MDNQAPALPVRFSAVSDSITRASIGSDWSVAVDLIRVGYVLKTNDGGEGVVFQVTSNYLYLTVVTPFSRQEYSSGNWYLYCPTVTDITKFLPELLQDTKLIPELFDELQTIVNDVDDSVLRLNYSKDYSKTDSQLITRTLNDLGIQTYLETVSVPVLRRLLNESVPLRTYLGRRKSLDYIGLSFDANIKVIQMWTNDYVHFYEEGTVPLGETGYYPTNYVTLSYDEKTGLTEDVIAELFYQLAWVCLVLYEVQQSIKFSTDNTLVVTTVVEQDFQKFVYADSTSQQSIDNTYLDEIPSINFTP